MGDGAGAPSLGHLLDECLDVVTHKEQFLCAAGLGGMYREFGGRQREDQPAVARIGERLLEDVTEERAVGLSIRAVHDDVCTSNHVANRSSAAPAVRRSGSGPRSAA